MLTSISVTSNIKGYDTLSFHMDGRNGYVLEDATGLEPSKATLAHTENAMLPGGVYHSSSIPTRNIVLKVGFDPIYEDGQTVDSLREAIYRVVPPPESVVLGFYKDGVLYKRITGRVESIDAPIFSKEPKLQISVISSIPQFRGNQNMVHEYLNQDIHDIAYDGDVDWGFRASVRIAQNGVNWIEIVNHTPSGSPRVRVTGPLNSGETCIITTIVGSKEAVVVDSESSVLRRLSGNMVSSGGWPVLSKGNNRLQIRSNISNGLRTDLSYQNYYRGL